MNAENSPEQGNGTPPAGGQELSIPKHRFDEVTARLREAEEREKLKDKLYQDQLQNFRSQQAPRVQEPEMTHEESGLDPQTHQAAMKIASKVVQKHLSDAEKKFNNVLGHLGNELEVSKFLLKHGVDKEGYLEKVRNYQQRQMQTTNQFMDVETAYKLVRFDEQEAASRRQPNQAVPPQGSNSQPAVDNAQSYPNPAHTRVQPGAGAANAGAPKHFSELNVEEMEARIDEQLKGGSAI